MSEVERLKQALALTREHNMKVTEENQRLPPPPAPRTDPVVVKAHPPPVVKPTPDRSPASISIPKKRARTRLYGGDKPLRTRWPVEDA